MRVYSAFWQYLRAPEIIDLEGRTDTDMCIYIYTTYNFPRAISSTCQIDYCRKTMLQGRPLYDYTTDNIKVLII